MKRHALQSIYYILRLRCASFAWLTIIVVGVKRDSYHNDMQP